MNAEEKRARREAIELARWLTPLPTLDSSLLPAPLAEPAAQDLATGNQFGDDGSILPDLGPLEPLGNWLSVAATIQRKSQQLSGFNPVITEFNELTWSDYISKLSSAPFWLQTNQNSREVRISQTSLNKAVEAIDDLVTAIATEDTYNAIITSIKKIATVAIENEGQEQKDNFQQEGVLSIKASNLSVGFLRTSIQMEYKSGKGYEQLNQELNVFQWYGILDFAKCKRSAATILSWDKSDVDEWASDTSSYDKVANDSPAWDN